MSSKIDSMSQLDDKTKEQLLTDPVFLKPSRMYILIWDGMDTGHAINTAVHAGAMISSKWPRFSRLNPGDAELSEDSDMAAWYDLSFRKVTCMASDEEFIKAKSYGLEHFMVTESAYGGREVAMVFKPRQEYPKFFSFLKLYK